MIYPRTGCAVLEPGRSIAQLKELRITTKNEQPADA